MNVKIYDVNGYGEETLRSECDLLECFPDGALDDEYLQALAELRDAGRFWVGGGAAPLVLLMRVS